MRLLKFIGIGFLAATLAALVLQRRAIARARQENESLRQQNEEVGRLASENGGIPRLRLENEEVEALKATHPDLLKLRNEVCHLRDHLPQLAKLRQENQRLGSEIKSLADGKPLRLAQMEDYVAKETWSNVGFATPEGALQTFLWAIREGQSNQIAECISPDKRARFEKQFAQMHLQEGIGLAKMTGYRMAEKEQALQDQAQTIVGQTPAPDENRVILGIQAAAGGAVIKWHLKRSGDEWKIEDW